MKFKEIVIPEKRASVTIRGLNRGERSLLREQNKTSKGDGSPW